MAAGWSARLHHRLGAAIQKAALRDFRTGRVARPTLGSRIALALALPVLATPVLVAVAGAALVWLGWPTFSGFVYGGLLLSLAWWLRPQRQVLPDGLLTRTDLPRTFRLLDAITSRVAAPEIDAIRVDESFNAYANHAQNKRFLGIGVVLWQALEPQEKLAMLGHEVGHLVNNDPARGVAMSQARATLHRWDYVMRPSRDDHLVTWAIFALPCLAVALWDEILGRLSFAASQRAEYLADSIAAQIAGTAAAIEALRKVSLEELAGQEMRHGQAETAASGTELVARISATVRAAPPEQRARLLQVMEDQELVVDGSHPPTRYRIGFLQALGEAGQARDDAMLLRMLAEAETELAPRIEAAGLKLQDMLVRQ